MLLEVVTAAAGVDEVELQSAHVELGSAQVELVVFAAAIGVGYPKSRC